VSAQGTPQSGAVLAGGQDRAGPPSTAELPTRGARRSGFDGDVEVASIVAQGPAAEGPCETQSAAPSAASRTAAGPWMDSSAWPGWAARQLERAVAVAAATPAGVSVAAQLYRNWFNYPLAEATGDARVRYGMPLAGVYRADGWWRTWGHHWTPPRRRTGFVRIVLSPAPDRLAAVVRTVTGAFLDSAQPWALACASKPHRVRRCAAVLLDLPSADAVPADLLAALTPVLRPELPPLCLPLAAGVGLASHPPNGMTFGEHRCHLIALALRRPDAEDDPLQSIAEVFGAHGIDPAAPHRYVR